MDNRVFFPQSAVDQWGIDGKIDLVAGELILLAHGRRFKVEEAVHVVSEVTGAPDGHQVLGKVRARQALSNAGAELLENSMILGENAYEVVPGWLGRATCSFAEYLMASNKDDAGSASDPTSDEELLQLFASNPS